VAKEIPEGGTLGNGRKGIAEHNWETSSPNTSTTMETLVPGFCAQNKAPTSNAVSN
jgi:hypothetical protein